MSAEVRVATDSDLGSILAHHGGVGGETPWDPSSALDKIRRLPREGLLVATVGGQYAGFLFWYEGSKPWYDRSVERYAMIGDLHLLPEFQGEGVGRTLLSDALRRIKAKGIPTVFLETEESNHRARQLYESVGFAEFGPRILRYRFSTGVSP